IQESYTREDGTVGERPYAWVYKVFPFTQAWSNGLVQWSGLFLLSASTPAGGTVYLSDPTNDITTAGSLTNIFPLRLQLVVADAENNHTTLFYNRRQQLTGAVPDGGPVITNIYSPGTADGYVLTTKNVDSGAFTTLVFSSNGLPSSIMTPLGLQMLYGWDRL